jgi:predicted MPP superfamily phosphohydrolase
MVLIYLLLFASPQLLLYLYLRERLPRSGRPALAVLFTIFNIPWLIVSVRMFSGSLWGISRIPWIAPWIAWQLLGWIFSALVALYLLGKGVWWLVQKVRGEWGIFRDGAERRSNQPRPGDVTRRQFLARATYTYAAAGLGLSAYGIYGAERLPVVTRRTLFFTNLPTGLDGLRIAHLSDVHAGVHMGREKMDAIVKQTNALGADLIVQTGDMIDISQSFIPDYVRSFRDLTAPLGVVTVLGNHDRYTGEAAVARGVLDAGQVLVQNSLHIVEHRDAHLALIGLNDPRNWRADDPQQSDLGDALDRAPSATAAFRILLAHRPGAFDGAIPYGIPLTLAGHIHGGQFYLPVVGWSPGRLITKYVMGHFEQGESQLYVSRGIGVVGIPLRIFAPPEIALLELRRMAGPAA